MSEILHVGPNSVVVLKFVLVALHALHNTADDFHYGMYSYDSPRRGLGLVPVKLEDIRIESPMRQSVTSHKQQHYNVEQIGSRFRRGV